MRKKFINSSGSKSNESGKKRETISKKCNDNGIKKRYLKSRAACKVTFRLPKDSFENAYRVSIVGDFNDWDNSATLMKKLGNGDFSVTLDLERDREFRFRYLIDNTQWENDWQADKYIPNPFGDEDSVVIT